MKAYSVPHDAWAPTSSVSNATLAADGKGKLRPLTGTSGEADPGIRKLGGAGTGGRPRRAEAESVPGDKGLGAVRAVWRVDAAGGVRSIEASNPATLSVAAQGQRTQRKFSTRTPIEGPVDQLEPAAITTTSAGNENHNADQERMERDTWFKSEKQAALKNALEVGPGGAYTDPQSRRGREAEVQAPSGGINTADPVKTLKAGNSRGASSAQGQAAGAGVAAEPLKSKEEQAHGEVIEHEEQLRSITIKAEGQAIVQDQMRPDSWKILMNRTAKDSNSKAAQRHSGNTTDNFFRGGKSLPEWLPDTIASMASNATNDTLSAAAKPSVTAAPSSAAAVVVVSGSGTQSGDSVLSPTPWTRFSSSEGAIFAEAEEKARKAVELLSACENSVRSAAEKARRAEELRLAAEEEAHSAEQLKLQATEAMRLAEEAHRLAEEEEARMKEEEARKKAFEEARAAEKVAHDAKRAAEDAIRVAEELATMAEEARHTALQKTKLARRRAAKPLMHKRRASGSADANRTVEEEPGELESDMRNSNHSMGDASSAMSAQPSSDSDSEIDRQRLNVERLEALLQKRRNELRLLIDGTGSSESDRSRREASQFNEEAAATKIQSVGIGSKNSTAPGDDRDETVKKWPGSNTRDDVPGQTRHETFSPKGQSPINSVDSNAKSRIGSAQPTPVADNPDSSSYFSFEQRTGMVAPDPVPGHFLASFFFAALRPAFMAPGLLNDDLDYFSVPKRLRPQRMWKRKKNTSKDVAGRWNNESSIKAEEGPAINNSLGSVRAEVETPMKPGKKRWKMGHRRGPPSVQWPAAFLRFSRAVGKHVAFFDGGGFVVSDAGTQASNTWRPRRGDANETVPPEINATQKTLDAWMRASPEMRLLLGDYLEFLALLPFIMLLFGCLCFWLAHEVHPPRVKTLPRDKECFFGIAMDPLEENVSNPNAGKHVVWFALLEFILFCCLTAHALDRPPHDSLRVGASSAASCLFLLFGFLLSARYPEWGLIQHSDSMGKLSPLTKLSLRIVAVLTTKEEAPPPGRRF